MSTDIDAVIAHYQRAIKKADRNEAKLLHSIRKLSELPITINCLQKTGIGKTINSLRKFEGDVGVSAKVLVSRWKTMVSVEETMAAKQEEVKEIKEDREQKDNIKQQKQNKYDKNDQRRTLNKTDNTKDFVELGTSTGNGGTQSGHKFRTEQVASNEVQNNTVKVHSTPKLIIKFAEGESPKVRVSEYEKHNGNKPKHSTHATTPSEDLPTTSNTSKETTKKHKSKHSERDKSKSRSEKSHKEKKEDKHLERSHKNASPPPEKKNSTSEPDERRSKKRSHGSNEMNPPTAKQPKIKMDNGIDSSMGASFSDALDMCNIPSHKRNKSKKISTTTDAMDGNHQEKEAPTTRRQFELTLEPSRTEVKYEVKSELKSEVKYMAKDEEIPEALKSPPKTAIECPLKSLANPEFKITDNYRPIRPNRNMFEIEKPAYNIEDAFNIGICSKTMRTKVYSGVKTGPSKEVPRLFDCCSRVLQKNLDSLAYTGGVPYDVLRTVLEYATSQQLLNIESYNPYLIEDTDVLWETHVKRQCRSEVKQDDETWREMFLRCAEERERRLSILTKSIKLSQEQNLLPVRKTRLAYVDNVVKPPRNIIRKQEKYGTTGKLVVSPAARVAALSSVTQNITKAGDARLRAIGDAGSTSSGSPGRPKKAPLMMKTLQFMKKQYKR